MPSTSSKNKRSSSSRKPTLALQLWKKAAQKFGYMKGGSGEFNKLPKKGTKEYNQIYAEYSKLLREAK